MNDWIWLGALVLTNGLLLWSGKMRYEQGIWDGAFNQFLPHVRKAMTEYDADRARRVLDEYDARFGLTTVVTGDDDEQHP